MRKKWQLAVLALGLELGLVLAACSSFDETPEPTPPAEAGTVEAGDTGGDSGARDAASGRFCATIDATFCADFDEGPLDAGWSSLEINEGKVGLTPSDKSPPNALLASCGPPRDAGSPDASPRAAAALIKRLTHVKGTAGRVSVDFDVRVASVSLSATLLGGVGYGYETNFLSVFGGADGTLSAFAVDTSRDAGTPGVSFGGAALKTWQHVRLEADFPGGMRVLVDNVERFRTTVGLFDITTDYFVVVGTSVDVTGATATVAYDNVVVTETP